MTTTTPQPPTGKPISGRSWKKPNPRASTRITLPPENNRSKTWSHHLTLRAERRATLEKERSMQEKRREAKLQKKERRLEQERRRAENEFQAARRSAQNMTKNVDLKLKAMNKKQLRMIKKTRMNVRTGVVEYVPAYAK